MCEVIDIQKVREHQRIKAETSRYIEFLFETIEELDTFHLEDLEDVETLLVDRLRKYISYREKLEKLQEELGNGITSINIE